MGRRGHGEGTIYQRKDGRWTAALTLDNHKRKTFYGKTRKEKQGKLKPKSMAQIQAALSSALENALKEGLVARNVAKLVALPRIERYEAQVLTVEQAQALLEAARGSRLDALLLVALTTGLRRGELLALRWSDTDLERGVLPVRRTLTWVR